MSNGSYGFSAHAEGSRSIVDVEYAIYYESKKEIMLFYDINNMARQHFARCSDDDTLDMRLIFPNGRLKIQGEGYLVTLSHMDEGDARDFNADFADLWHGIEMDDEV